MVELADAMTGNNTAKILSECCAGQAHWSGGKLEQLWLQEYWQVGRGGWIKEVWNPVHGFAPYDVYTPIHT